MSPAPFPPIEPPGSSALWEGYLRAGLQAAETPPGDVGEVVGVGGRLDPASLLAAYRHGIFPMGLGEGGTPPMGWWCPRWRGVLEPGTVHVLSLIHISEPTRQCCTSRMPSSA